MDLLNWLSPGVSGGRVVLASAFQKSSLRVDRGSVAGGGIVFGLFLGLCVVHEMVAGCGELEGIQRGNFTLAISMSITRSGFIPSEFA